MNDNSSGAQAGQLHIGSLFSGAGLLDLAARAVLTTPGCDARVVWHSDTKPASAALLAHHHPEIPNLGDITTIDFDEIATTAPVDVATAGWPCQPHSAAGRRLGEKDPRALWPHVHRAIAALRPRVFLGENVSRIVTNGELARVVASLADLGYVGTWRCSNASDLGAPHRRTRCFLIALDPTRPLPAFDDEPLPHIAEKPPNLVLLPTPSQRDGRRGAGWGDLAGRPLSETIHRIADGNLRQYRPAVERWAYITDRAAPRPCIPGRLGDPVLNPAFTEWMMGAPKGHVTDVPGLTREQRISLLGDGVVWLAATAAYTELFGRMAQQPTQKTA